MDKKVLKGILAGVAAVFFFISVFSNSIVSRSKRRMSFSIGYNKLEVCKRNRCESMSLRDMKRFEQDVVPFGEFLFYYNIAVGGMGIGMLIRWLMAKDPTKLVKTKKAHIGFIITAAIATLGDIGWMMTLSNLRGLKGLEAGTGFYMALIGGIIAVVSLFIAIPEVNTQNTPLPPPPAAPLPPPPAPPA